MSAPEEPQSDEPGESSTFGGSGEADNDRGRIVRDETPAERLDRNWNELLQEMRVIQTGIQILLGFLLILPFQGRFTDLSDGERDLYLGVLAVVAVATVTNLSPVIAHRVLFRRHEKESLMLTANGVAITSLICLGLALVLGVTLVVSVALDASAARWTAAGLSALLILGWVGLPVLVHGRREAS